MKFYIERFISWIFVYTIVFVCSEFIVNHMLVHKQKYLVFVESFFTFCIAMVMYYFLRKWIRNRYREDIEKMDDLDRPGNWGMVFICLISIWWLSLYPISVLGEHSTIYKYSYLVTYQNGDREEFDHYSFIDADYEMHYNENDYLVRSGCATFYGQTKKKRVCGIRFFEPLSKEIYYQGIELK